MKYLRKSLVFLFIFTQFFEHANSDLPVHCMSGEIEGVWLIHLGDNNGDSDIKCGHKRPDQNLDHMNTKYEKVFKKKFETMIQLERPNYVWDVNDNSKLIGKWTMIYDEGFEFEIGPQVFFAFSKYRQVGRFTAKNTDTEETPGYQNECEKTFVGWYHNLETNENWGCFWGEKLTADRVKKYNTKLIDYQNIFKYSRIPLLPQGKSTAQMKELTMNKPKNDLLKLNSLMNDANITTETQKKGNDLFSLMEELSPSSESIHTQAKTSSGINSGNDYVDFVKSLNYGDASSEYDGGLANIPHLDIYFLNMLNKEDDGSGSSSNFLEMNMSTRLFQPDYNFVMRVNSPNSKYKWTAKIYDEFIGKSYSHMRSLLGNSNSLKLPLGSTTPIHRKSFLELEVKVTHKMKDSFKSDSLFDVLPTNFSWGNIDGMNYDSPLRKQGECGSCYSIAAVSVLEARIRIKTNNRLKPLLSPSSVIACSKYNQGCAGGYPYLVGKFGKEFGFVEESCHPYSETDDKCMDFCYHQRKYRVKSYGYVGGYYGGCDEESMMKEIFKNGPIVVAINATPELYYYEKGIFHSNAKKTAGKLEKNVKPWEYTNHAVVCIGWGEETLDDKVEKYWILKNSWGDQWGEKGYFRMLRGVDNGSVEAQGIYLSPDLE